MVKVKICGIMREEDLEIALEAGADAVGFVVCASPSPRNLTLTEARKLVDEVPSKVDSVAVTTFNGMGKLMEIYNELKTSFIQLHGRIGVPISRETLPKTGLIKAVNAKATNALEEAVEAARLFEIILADTSDEGGMGGTGITHDWRISRRIREAIQPKPLILAGGLTPENVGAAIKTVQPYAVDVSSGVEERPGVKDREKIFKFIASAKGDEP